MLLLLLFCLNSSFNPQPAGYQHSRVGSWAAQHLWSLRPRAFQQVSCEGLSCFSSFSSPRKQHLHQGGTRHLQPCSEQKGAENPPRSKWLLALHPRSGSPGGSSTDWSSTAPVTTSVLQFLIPSLSRLQHLAKHTGFAEVLPSQT